MTPSTRTCVYRVLQEALHNCEKHARATLVTVAVSGSPEALTVVVEDNGCGFKTASTSNEQRQIRFGLLGMRERAAALGGEGRIDSAPGKGSRITLSLPVRAASAGARAMAGGRA